MVIEAKIDHYRRAMDQALLRRYLADFVYVGFPDGYARSVLRSRAEAMMGSGVGLLSVSRRGVRKLIVAKRSSVVSRDLRGHVLDSFVSGGKLVG